MPVISNRKDHVKSALTGLVRLAPAFIAVAGIGFGAKYFVSKNHAAAERAKEAEVMRQTQVEGNVKTLTEQIEKDRAARAEAEKVKKQKQAEGAAVEDEKKAAAKAEADQKAAEAQVWENARIKLAEAFKNGQKKITYESGNTYGILSNVDVNGDTVVTAHKVKEISPAGDVLSVETAPTVMVKIPAAKPAAPAPK